MNKNLITVEQLVFDPEKKEVYTQKYTIFKENFMYYLDDSKTLQNFIPYEVKGINKYSKGTLIPDISLIKELLIDSKDKIKMIDTIQKSHYEDIDKVWEQIEWIKQQKFGQEEKKDNEETKPKRKRKVKIPLQCCKSINEFPENEDIMMINYYSSKIDDKEYLFDIISTKQGHFYVNVTDITDEYNEIDFNEFKRKYCQPTLFDDFFEI